MIHSMTAYAKQEYTDDIRTVSVEMRSYNSKYLDLVLRIPNGYDALEDRIRAAVKKKILRGRVELRLHIQDTEDDAVAFEVNRSQATAYYKALTHLKTSLQLTGDITLDHMTSCNGLISAITTEKDPDAAWPPVESCLQGTIEELTAMRRKEGAFLQKDFETRLQKLETDIALIEQSANGLTDYYRERLQDRIETLTKGLVEIDPARIAQEAAFLSDRSDISEEIVRSRSHLQQFRQLMTAPEPAGRKLNFLLQEFNREFNTMGAKAGKAEISHIIVTLKSELEKIREQVQNVE